MAQDRPDRDDEGVLVLVCIACGREYSFTGEPPAAPSCDKCGNTVFRAFHDTETEDEAAADFRESTGRDTGTVDGPTDIERGDLEDLRND